MSMTHCEWVMKNPYLPATQNINDQQSTTTLARSYFHLHAARSPASHAYSCTHLQRAGGTLQGQVVAELDCQCLRDQGC